MASYRLYAISRKLADPWEVNRTELQGVVELVELTVKCGNDLVTLKVADWDLDLEPWPEPLAAVVNAWLGSKGKMVPEHSRKPYTKVPDTGLV